MQKSIIIAVVVGFMALAGGGYWFYGQQQDAPILENITPSAGDEVAPVADVAPTPAPAPVEADLKPTDIIVPVNAASALEPRVLGNPDAPITMVEYSSFTCPHCAHFHADVLPTLLKDYVATGKVKIVMQDFPLNREALDASLLARCMPNDKFMGFATAVFQNIDTWAAAHPATLKQYAGMSGLDAAKIDSCLADKAVEDSIVAGIKMASEKHKINSTPSFVINDTEVLSGVSGAGVFAQKFDAILNPKSEPSEPKAAE